MSSFDTDVVRVLNDFDREFQLIAEIGIQFGSSTSPPNPSLDVWLSTDPPGIKGPPLGFAIVHPVARKLGRVLAYQDTDIFGRAQGSMTIEARNETVVWPQPVFNPPSGYVKLSEILTTGNVLGLPVKLWLLVQTDTGPVLEQLGDYTLDKVDLLPDTVRFRVLDLEPYIRDVPLSTIDSATLGTGLSDPDDEFQGRPIPLQFGVMGKGVGTFVEPGSVGTGPLLELFRGYVTPYNPAPCVGLYRTYVSPTETAVRTVLVCQDGGVPPSSGLLRGNLINENLYYATDDGRFAYLNTIESLFAFNSDNRAWLGLIEGINVPGATDRTITGVSINMAAQTAALPVFPWADTDTSGTNAIWDTAVAVMGDEREAAASRMFSDMMEPFTTLELTVGADYAEVWGYMPDEPNHGPVRSFDAFAVLTFGPQSVDVRFKLDIDDTVTTVQALTVTSGANQIITSAFDVRNSGSTKQATIDDWYRWRFEYENTTPNERRRSKFAVGFKLSAGATQNQTLLIQNSGLKVTYVPGAFKTVHAPIETVSGLADPIFPGLYNDTRLRTVKLTEVDASTRFFVSTDGVVDDGSITLTSGALLHSPVNHIHMLYGFWGKSGALFRAEVPDASAGSHDSDYGNWATAESMLDDLLQFYTGDSTGWKSSYTVSHQAKLDVHVEEFRRHLPLDVWKDRKGRLRCATWTPSPLAGELFPPGLLDFTPSVYTSGYLGWAGLPASFASAYIHPQHVKRVKNIGLTDAERTHTEFVVHWGFDKGRNEYRHKAICNSGIFDDGFSNNWDSFFDGLHQQTCEDAQERAVGVRTLTRMAPTISTVFEAASMLMHYVRRYTMRHIVLELELDLAVSDMEKWQLVRLAPDSVTRESFGGVSMPYHGIDWGGDVAVAGSEWWRVMRKFYDYDAQSVHVTLMHVAGVK